MLDNLGLGIVLTMRDDFTPQANKAVQSMDRMTRKAEEMERDMQRSMSNLQNIMLAGFSLDQVGGKIDKAGRQILGAFESMGRAVVNVNKDFEMYKRTMGTFFKEEAQEALDWGVEFAKKTPFFLGETIQAMNSFKAVGVDVRKQYKGVNGEMKTLMEYVGDLAGINPEQGVSGAMFAVRNLLEGDARSFERRFNIKMSSVLGRKVSKDPEKAMEDFVQVVSKLAPNLMNNLVGSWNQVMANLADSWTFFLWKMGEHGAFDTVKKSIVDLIGVLDSLDMEKVTKPLSDVMTALWKPIDFLIKASSKLAVGFLGFVEKYPLLGKMLIGFVALAGASMVLIGTIMKLAGSFLILGASLSSAIINMKVLKTLKIVNAFSGLGNTIGIASRALGIFGIVTGAVTLGYMKNVGGMRDQAQRLGKDWRLAGDIISRGVSKSFREMADMGDGQVSRLVNSLIKLQLVGTVLGRTLFGKVDENGFLQYTAQEVDNLRAMGLLPFAQTMAMLRGRVTSFAEGFLEGLTSVYKMLKNMLDFVLVPIKAVFETLSKLAPFKALGSIFGVKGEGGILGEEAESQMAQFERLGQIAGSLLGTLLGFKAVKSIGSVLVSPFQSLFGMLSKSKKSLGGFQNDFYSVLDPKTGKTYNPNSMMGRFTRAKNHFGGFLNERSSLPTNRGNGSDFQQAYSSGIPHKFRNHILSQNPNADMSNIYTKRRNPLMEKMFGAKYYSKDAQGNMQSIGSYGGRAMQNRDDQQLRLAMENFQGKGGTIKPLSLNDYIMGKDGNQLTGDAYKQAMRQYHFDRRNHIRMNNQTAMMSNLKGSPLDSLKQQSSNLVAQQEALIQAKMRDPEFRKQAYAHAGIKDSRIFNGADLATDPARRNQRDAILRSYAHRQSDVQGIGRQIGATRNQLSSSDQAIFQARQSKLSQFLFGQRFYTPEMGADGTFHERTVARRGGIFRNPANDMVYRNQGDTSLRGRLGVARDRFNQSRLGQGLAGVRGRMGALGTGAGNLLGRARAGLGAIGGRLGGIAQTPLNMINNQRARLGWGAMTGGGMLKGAGKGVLGVGKGIGKGIGAVGRGAKGLLGGVGRLGMGAMNMLPMAMMLGSFGKMGFNAIKEKGGGDFGAGVKVLQDQIKDMDFGEVFTGFLNSFKETTSAFFPLVRDIFFKIGEAMPVILSQSWEGIKAMGALAFQFISEHGMTILNGFVGMVLGLFNNVWNWLMDSGLQTIGNLVGKAVEWLIGTGVPMIIKALLGIGAWLLTDGLVGLVQICGTIAISMGKALWDGLTGALSGLGNAIGKILIGGLRGVIKGLLPDSIAEQVFKVLGIEGQVDTHHGGLWMSPDEHPAIIKRNETVLPPDKSKKLDEFLSGSGTVGSRAKSQPQQVDNSVNIDKVEIVVQADKLSRADARNQALIILEELKKLQKEKNIRAYI